MEVTCQLNAPTALTPASALQIKMLVYFLDFTHEYIRDISIPKVCRGFPHFFQ
jgi:hypothetical protein